MLCYLFESFGTFWNLLEYFGIFCLEFFGLFLIPLDSYGIFFNCSESFEIFWILLEFFQFNGSCELKRAIEYLIFICSLWGALGLESISSLVIDIIRFEIVHFSRKCRF